jgi:hypothetical protein
VQSEAQRFCKQAAAISQSKGQYDRRMQLPFDNEEGMKQMEGNMLLLVVLVTIHYMHARQDRSKIAVRRNKWGLRWVKGIELY